MAENLDEAFEEEGPRGRRRRGDDRRDDRDDEDDDRPRRRRRSSGSNGDDAVATIIPYRNSMALVGYYLSVFSLIPCVGLLLGPTAFVLGILGLRYVRRNPEAKGTGHSITALILGGLTALANWGLVVFFVAAAILHR